jgi:hypothetical protein
MTPDQERKLDTACEMLARIDERTENMRDRCGREMLAVHERITNARKESAQDVKDLRSEVKRLSGFLSALVSAAVAGGAKLLGLGGS